jgi:hypothetical protein
MLTLLRFQAEQLAGKEHGKARQEAHPPTLCPKLDLGTCISAGIDSQRPEPHAGSTEQFR